MKENQKKPYERPTAETVRLSMRHPLLNVSGSENNGYGLPINEGDPDGWQ